MKVLRKEIHLARFLVSVGHKATDKVRLASVQSCLKRKMHICKYSKQACFYHELCEGDEVDRGHGLAAALLLLLALLLGGGGRLAGVVCEDSEG